MKLCKNKTRKFIHLEKETKSRSIIIAQGTQETRRRRERESEYESVSHLYMNIRLKGYMRIRCERKGR